jgi:hypothetical protein
MSSVINFPTKSYPTATPNWGGIGGILDIPKSYQIIVLLIHV